MRCTSQANSISIEDLRTAKLKIFGDDAQEATTEKVGLTLASALQNSL